MTSPGAELPDDLQSCQALVEQLRAELSAAVEQIAHLEGLVARHQETIADQEQALENLAASDLPALTADEHASIEALLEDLTQGLDAYPQSRHSVHVAAMRSCLDPRTCGFS